MEKSKEQWVNQTMSYRGLPLKGLLYLYPFIIDFSIQFLHHLAWWIKSNTNQLISMALWIVRSTNPSPCNNTSPLHVSIRRFSHDPFKNSVHLPLCNFHNYKTRSQAFAVLSNDVTTIKCKYLNYENLLQKFRWRNQSLSLWRRQGVCMMISQG